MDTKKAIGLAGNKMDIEETIYALEELEKNKLHYHSQAVFCAIKLLKRGEKYERIFNELENCLLPEQYKVVEKLEQKYFPKPVKKTIIIEAKDKESMEKILKLFQSDAKCFDVDIKEGMK